MPIFTKVFRTWMVPSESRWWSNNRPKESFAQIVTLGKTPMSRRGERHFHSFTAVHCTWIHVSCAHDTALIEKCNSGCTLRRFRFQKSSQNCVSTTKYPVRSYRQQHVFHKSSFKECGIPWGNCGIGPCKIVLQIGQHVSDNVYHYFEAGPWDVHSIPVEKP